MNNSNDYLIKDKRLYVDLDGVLNKFKKIKSYDELFKKGFYSSAEPSDRMINLINLLRSRKIIYVCVLTKYPDKSKHAISDKKEWLDRYLYGIDVIYVPDSKFKQDYVDDFNKNCYLLDDYTKNLVDWEEAGGTGIKLLNGINNTRKTWKGRKIDLLKSDEGMLLDLLIRLDIIK